jgi:hypothetical protein
MTPSVPQFDELGLLTAALCDGEITPQEALRLESLVAQSEAGRRYFLDYLRLHAELSWENGAGAGRSEGIRDRGLGIGETQSPGAAQPSELPSGQSTLTTRALPARNVSPAAKRRPSGDRPQRIHRFAWPRSARRRMGIAVAMAAGLAAVAFVAWTITHSRTIAQRASSSEPSRAVARLVRTVGAQWGEANGAPSAPGDMAAGVALRTGQKLHLREGLAEIAFDRSARVILAAPATVELGDSAQEVCLRSGMLTANVPHEAIGFTVRTPSAKVVDRGTEFGVAVDHGGVSEVQVFVGSVDVQPETGPDVESMRRSVAAGQAVRISLSQQPATAARIEDLAAGARRFVRSLTTGSPARGSVARLREIVSRHPNLIHHYPFEGNTLEEKCRDRRGGLDLEQVVMFAGRGGGALNASADGFDPSTNAVAAYRSAQAGNAQGVGLQSQAVFNPPSAFSVELLLSFAGSPEGDGLISVAVGTRDDERNCGFFVVAADHGQLVHLMDGLAPWVEGEVEFAPGEWYYVASTFSVEKDHTTINSYVANLSRGEGKLSWVVKNQSAAGVPAASRLGIGKGFNATVAHAYPWSGALDEVAIYNTVLDRKTLQEHLESIVGIQTGGEP